MEEKKKVCLLCSYASARLFTALHALYFRELSSQLTFWLVQLVDWLTNQNRSESIIISSVIITVTGRSWAQIGHVLFHFHSLIQSFFRSAQLLQTLFFQSVVLRPVLCNMKMNWISDCVAFPTSFPRTQLNSVSPSLLGELHCMLANEWLEWRECAWRHSPFPSHYIIHVTHSNLDSRHCLCLCKPFHFGFNSMTHFHLPKFDFCLSVMGKGDGRKIY